MKHFHPFVSGILCTVSTFTTLCELLGSDICMHACFGGFSLLLPYPDNTLLLLKLLQNFFKIECYCVLLHVSIKVGVAFN